MQGLDYADFIASDRDKKKKKKKKHAKRGGTE